MNEFLNYERESDKQNENNRKDQIIFFIIH
jgi:hypothetical protein